MPSVACNNSPGDRERPEWNTTCGNYLLDPSQENVRALYDAAARTYEENRPLSWQAQLAHFDDFIVDGIGSVGTVCEVGVGTGRLLQRVRAQTKVGLDLSHQMCALSRHRPGLAAIQGDQAALCFKDGVFDAVVSGYAAGRYTPLPTFLSEISRVLKNGGRFGIHLFTERCLSLRGMLQFWKPDLRYSPAPPPASCHNLSDWGQTQSLFGKAGLWIEQHYLMRALPRPPYGWRIPHGAAMILANEVGLIGRRIARDYLDFLRALSLALADHGVCQVAPEFVKHRERNGRHLKLTLARTGIPRVGQELLIAQSGCCTPAYYLGRLGSSWLVVQPGGVVLPRTVASWQVLGRIL